MNYSNILFHVHTMFQASRSLNVSPLNTQTTLKLCGNFLITAINSDISTHPRVILLAIRYCISSIAAYVAYHCIMISSIVAYVTYSYVAYTLLLMPYVLCCL